MPVCMHGPVSIGPWACALSSALYCLVVLEDLGSERLLPEVFLLLFFLLSWGDSVQFTGRFESNY